MARLLSFFIPAVLLSLSCGFYLKFPHYLPDLPPADVSRMTLQFGALYFFQFLCLGWITLGVRKGLQVSPFWIFFFAILCRGILFFSFPVLEDDFYRYAWDGKVFAQGVNPYLFAPGAVSLDGLHVFWRKWINYPTLSTIYPPLAQVLFVWNEWFWGRFSETAPFLGLRLLFLVFDLGTGAVLVAWLKKKSIPVSWSLLYLLNPLVLKEITNSIHLDSLVSFLFFLSLYLFVELNSRRGAWGLLALASCTKIYPLLLAPFYFRLDPGRIKGATLYCAVVLGFFLPFYFWQNAGWAVFEGLRVFGEVWVFNAGLYELVLALTRAPDLFIRAALGFLFLAFYVWIFWVTRRTAVLPEAAFFILGGVLIFSPVLDPWYLVWILPLAVLFRSPAWLFLSFFVWGAYAWYLFEGLPGRWDKGWGPVARMIEYGGFYGILLWQGWFRRNMRPRELAGSAARV